jgi:hypothetical protein
VRPPVVDADRHERVIPAGVRWPSPLADEAEPDCAVGAVGAADLVQTAVSAEPLRLSSVTARVVGSDDAPPTISLCDDEWPADRALNLACEFCFAVDRGGSSKLDLVVWRIGVIGSSVMPSGTCTQLPVVSGWFHRPSARARGLPITRASRMCSLFG